MFNIGYLTEGEPLMYHGRGGWRVWSRGTATQYMRNGIASVRRKWTGDRRGAEARLISQEVALHSGRIGGGNKTGCKDGDRDSGHKER